MPRLALRYPVISVFAVALLALAAFVVGARPAAAESVQYRAGTATTCHRDPDLNSPPVGSLSAGETFIGSDLLLGAAAVTFVRATRLSGQDLGYCPAYGPGFTNNLTAVATGSPLVFGGTSVVAAAPLVTSRFFPVGGVVHHPSVFGLGGVVHHPTVFGLGGVVHPAVVRHHPTVVGLGGVPVLGTTTAVGSVQFVVGTGAFNPAGCPASGCPPQRLVPPSLQRLGGRGVR